MRFQMITVIATLSVFGATVPEIHADLFRNRDNCHVTCPHCSSPCRPVVHKENETKHCWGIQCKTICIPRVTFPWE